MTTVIIDETSPVARRKNCLSYHWHVSFPEFTKTSQLLEFEIIPVQDIENKLVSDLVESGNVSLRDMATVLTYFSSMYLMPFDERKRIEMGGYLLDRVSDFSKRCHGSSVIAYHAERDFDTEHVLKMNGFSAKGSTYFKSIRPNPL